MRTGAVRVMAFLQIICGFWGGAGTIRDWLDGPKPTLSGGLVKASLVLVSLAGSVLGALMLTQRRALATKLSVYFWSIQTLYISTTLFAYYFWIGASLVVGWNGQEIIVLAHAGNDLLLGLRPRATGFGINLLALGAVFVLRRGMRAAEFRGWLESFRKGDKKPVDDTTTVT